MALHQSGSTKILLECNLSYYRPACSRSRLQGQHQRRLSRPRSACSAMDLPGANCMLGSSALPGASVVRATAFVSVDVGRASCIGVTMFDVVCSDRRPGNCPSCASARPTATACRLRQRGTDSSLSLHSPNHSGPDPHVAISFSGPVVADLSLSAQEQPENGNRRDLMRRYEFALLSWVS